MTLRAANLLTVVLAAVVLAGCSGDEPTDTTTAATCRDVTLGTPEGYSQPITATVDDPRDVPCDTAQLVVREWARQQVGLGTAKLPAGWSCDESSVCRSSGSSVTFTLNYPYAVE